MIAKGLRTFRVVSLLTVGGRIEEKFDVRKRHFLKKNQFNITNEHLKGRPPRDRECPKIILC